MEKYPYAIDLKNVGKKYTIRTAMGKSEKAHPLKIIKSSSHEDFWALSDINLKIRPRERVGIIGKNGAGKSTLLKLLARITEPTCGRIELLGKLSAMLEVGTGFNPELTGRENVYLNGAILGMSKSEIDKNFDKILEFSEIGAFIDMPVKRYSSGMYVRLAFSVASHLEADILILDEVFAVGDQKFRQKCIDRIKEILQSEKTILCVSHQMGLIRELCDRVIVLDAGQVVFDGDTESAIDFYTNKHMESSQTLFDLSSCERPSYLTPTAQMTSLEFKNHDEFMGGKDKKLSFEINLRALEDLADIKLRLMVRYYDDTKAGFAQLSSGINAKEGKIVKQNFTFDTSSLFPGKYIAGLALFSSDTTGKAEHFDYIREAFSFEVPEDSRADKPISYSHRDWGHVYLGELKES